MINVLFYLLINKLNKVDLRLMCFCVIWREIIDFNGRLPPPLFRKRVGIALQATVETLYEKQNTEFCKQ